MLLNQKVIVVTGGAGLLGRQFSAVIAKQNGLAIVADLRHADAERISAEIRAAGGRSEAVALDITDGASINNLIASLHARHGRIDAVVNSAYPRNPNWGRGLEDVAYSDFCDNVGRHLGGCFLVSQKFALYFRDHGGGNIINVASIYGTIAPRLAIYAGTPMTMPVEYAAIKSAIIHLTRYFAQYFKSDGIRCNTLSPGGILDRQPQEFVKKYNSYCGVKGMLDAHDIVGCLLFLLSDNSRYVTGQNLIVDDGFCL